MFSDTHEISRNRRRTSAHLLKRLREPDSIQMIQVVHLPGPGQHTERMGVRIRMGDTRRIRARTQASREPFKRRVATLLFSDRHDVTDRSRRDNPVRCYQRRCRIGNRQASGQPFANFRPERTIITPREGGV